VPRRSHSPGSDAFLVNAPRLFHFSEDPNIRVFKPRRSQTSNGEALVWAIGESHAPSYWFPRDCPRACCWTGDRPIPETSFQLLDGGARRMHAIESGWLQRVRDCRLYAYEFEASAFVPHLDDAGYWAARQDVIPSSIQPVGDLLDRHVEAAIEFRIVESLWPLIDAIVVSGLEFSIIRKANALPRRGSS